MVGQVVLELAGPPAAVPRVALKGAAAVAVLVVAVLVVAVPAARQVGQAMTVPRGPSVRAAPSEPRFVFSAARLSRRGGASRALLLPRRGHPPVEVGRDRSGF